MAMKSIGGHESSIFLRGRMEHPMRVVDYREETKDGPADRRMSTPEFELQSQQCRVVVEREKQNCPYGLLTSTKAGNVSNFSRHDVMR